MSITMAGFFRTSTAVVLVAALLSFASPHAAFHNPSRTISFASRRPTQQSTTQVNLFDILNEGKKALVKQLAGDYDAAAIRARIDGLIQDNSVLMLSFTTCPYCLKAKEVLDQKAAKYTVVELDQDSDGKAIRAELGDVIGRTSVPAIWINQQFVGGCNDGPMGGIVSLNKSGELDGLLKSAKAI